MQQKTIIEIKNVSKTYLTSGLKPKLALDQVTLNVNKSEVFGFLGPNGAGKTSLIKILVGLIRKYKGSCKVYGNLGYLPENSYFHHFLTAEEFLQYHGRLYGLSKDEVASKIPRLLEKVDLKRARDSHLRTFSKGMLQRIGFAQALMNDPDVMILDEPMTGLDPVGRREMRDMINEAALAGRTVFFSTHILADVEVICTTVGFINGGKLKGAGDIESLLGKTVKSMEVRFELPYQKDAHELSGFERARRTMDGWVLDIETNTEKLEGEVNNIIQNILKEKGQVRSVIPRKSTLEDLFFADKK